MNQAVANGELKKNPTESCKLPKVIKKEIQPLEDYQVTEFLDAVEGHVHEYLYKIALFTGLRQGELLGLTWDCIDFNKGTLTVKQQEPHIVNCAVRSSAIQVSEAKADLHGRKSR